MKDGSEVRLAGIEPVVAEKASRTSRWGGVGCGGGVGGVDGILGAAKDNVARGRTIRQDRYGRHRLCVSG